MPKAERHRPPFDHSYSEPVLHDGLGALSLVLPSAELRGLRNVIERMRLFSDQLLLTANGTTERMGVAGLANLKLQVHKDHLVTISTSYSKLERVPMNSNGDANEVRQRVWQRACVMRNWGTQEDDVAHAGRGFVDGLQGALRVAGPVCDARELSCRLMNVRRCQVPSLNDTGEESAEAKVEVTHALSYQAHCRKTRAMGWHCIA